MEVESVLMSPWLLLKWIIELELIEITVDSNIRAGLNLEHV